MFGTERYRAAEGIFDVKAALTSEGSPAPPQSQSLLASIKASLGQVDVDIRPHLLSNVVVTGGASLMQGFTERLNQELMDLYAGPRVRISAPGNMYERKYASWIGGSILASLGTFHQVRMRNHGVPRDCGAVLDADSSQMWISKKEYEEHGTGIVDKRCK